MLTSVLLGAVSCTRDKQPPAEALYGSIEQQFVSGELAKAEAASRSAQSSRQAADPKWAARFRLQRAKIRIYQGHSEDALELLRLPFPDQDPSLAATHDSLLAIAYHRKGDDVRARQALDRAARVGSDDLSRAAVSLAQGILDIENEKLDESERDFRLSLAGARAGGDKFLETQAELNLGVVALRQEHYDDALEHFGRATSLAKAIGAKLALEKAAGAYGSTLYKLGDFKAALASSRLAEEQASALGSPIDEVAWLDDEGLSQFRLGDLAAAKASYERTLELAAQQHDDEEQVERGEALTALAWLALESGDLPGALARAREAERLAMGRNEPAAAMQPAVVEALVEAREGDTQAAKRKLLGLERASSSKQVKQSVHWEVERALAKVDADGGDAAGAGMWFRRAIETFQRQRATIWDLDSRLPFLENGSSLYLDYMEFLIREGEPEAALAVLDRSRAESLAEGLGVRPERAGGLALNPQGLGLKAQELARRLGGTILVYCLRPGTSYLWAIGPRKMGFFKLAGRERIVPLVAAHTQAVVSSRDVLAQGDSPGLRLYAELVTPAAGILAEHGKVFVVADEALDTLNFESLPAPGGAVGSAAPRHYWIEDADIVNARSIGLLAASVGERETSGGRLLLVGDPVYDRAEDAPLAHAPEEVARVSEHFSPERRVVLTGAAATPEGYRGSHPEAFTYIHFVAHASASEMNPLDSSVILSQGRGGEGAYKLYARSILDQRLSADLVTISSCYGSGVRSYSGEGLVGLAWAFLRTGSHHVIGALWQVSDASTPQLMSDMYDRLGAGERPDEALRAAKLAMIHRGGVFRKPFYWAAFQLYSGA